ncbi:MAG: M18 family aminopeptidase [Clostridia bacterium]|nr:M18 family aminopeptidase [Clostridia bacterium]
MNPLLDFINCSPSQFHATATVAAILKENGFAEISENEKWSLDPGGRYFTIRNGSSLIAFEIPAGPINCIMAGSAHTDSPTYRIKENYLSNENGYNIVNTEPYGGMIRATWLDRPLSAAGRVTVRTKDGLAEKNIDLKEDLFIIPSVAIHMNRDCNSNASYNNATDMRPIYCPPGGKSLNEMIAEAAGCSDDDLLSSDLCLYSSGCRTMGDYICSPRLDDLQCLYGITEGLVRSQGSRALKLLFASDNEEVGSGTRQGADSDYLRDTVRRIFSSLSLTEEEFLTATENGIMVSADNAHAIHPNHPEYSDKNNHPEINKGIVIKYNASQKYATDSVSASVFKLICERAEVPYQVFANRSDLAGGSTIGSISSTHFPLRTVDIGLPQLAMHSAYETAGIKDTEYLIKAMSEFFGTYLEKRNNEYRILKQR